MTEATTKPNSNSHSNPVNMPTKLQTN